MNREEPNDIIKEWRESAPYWEKHRAVIELMFAPLTEALIQGAALAKGQSVLDVAGGVGEPSFTISDWIGPEGLVVCTDAASEMAAGAKAAAQQRSSQWGADLVFAVCNGEALPFQTDQFDAVVCRLGAMFFSEPVHALREMLRVLNVEGRLAVAVWHHRALNPFLNVVAEVMSRYVESPPEDPEAPGAFRFAESGKLAAVLKGAGAINVSERLFTFQVKAQITPEEFWQVRSEMSDTLRRKLAQLSPRDQQRVARESQAAAAAYFASGQMSFPAQTLIVAGAKTSSR